MAAAVKLGVVCRELGKLNEASKYFERHDWSVRRVDRRAEGPSRGTETRTNGRHGPETHRQSRTNQDNPTC